MNENAFDSLQKTLSNPNLTEDEKTKIIKDFGENYRKQIDKELNIYLTKQYAGAALEIASAAIPGTGIGKIGGKVAEKVLSKSIGRKLSNYIGEGIFSGAASGGIFGIGRGLMENQNPIYTAIEDATFSFLTGLVSTSILGKIEQNIAKNKLWSKPKQTHLSNEYYKNYERGINLERKDIGEIKLVSDGFKETNRQQPQYADKVIDLSKNLKTAKYIGEEPSQHAHKFNIIKFHRLGGKDVDYLIAENSKGNKYFHKVTSPNLVAGPKPEGRDLSNLKQMTSHLTKSTSGTESTPFFHIINDTIQKNNLDKWLFSNPSIPLSIHNNLAEIQPVTQTPYHKPETVATNEYKNIQPGSVLKTAINMTDYPQGKIFSSQDIEKMSQEIFEEYEPVIMQQVQDGSIFQQSNAIDYSGYKNPLSESSKIYTREDINNMTNQEFSEIEKEINSQLNTIGIPSLSELEATIASGTGGLIYVEPYTRNDGTPVTGYYRSA